MLVTALRLESSKLKAKPEAGTTSKKFNICKSFAHTLAVACSPSLSLSLSRILLLFFIPVALLLTLMAELVLYGLMVRKRDLMFVCKICVFFSFSFFFFTFVSFLLALHHKSYVRVRIQGYVLNTCVCVCVCEE